MYETSGTNNLPLRAPSTETYRAFEEEMISIEQELQVDADRLDDALWDKFRHDPRFVDKIHDGLVEGSRIFPGYSEEALLGYLGFKKGILSAIAEEIRMTAKLTSQTI